MPRKPTTKNNLLTVILNICYKKIETLCTPTTSKSLPSDTSDDELANRFSHFFIDKIQGIKRNLVHSDELDFSRFGSDKCDSSLSDFSLISEETVYDINMKSPSSACSLDPIPTWLLKMCQRTFANNHQDCKFVFHKWKIS